MSTLTFVRHAQASFFDDDYDQLSAIGQEQARRLGEYWLRQDVKFDEVYTGPRERHRGTAELVGQCFAQGDCPWPQPVVVPDLDEHEVDRVLKSALDDVVLAHPQLCSLAAAFAHAREREDYSRSFQQLFEALTHLWIRGELAPAAAITPWLQYRQRVCASLQEITKAKRGRRMVAFVSVGTMAATLQWILQCSDAQAAEHSWRLRNCSLTEVVFSGEKFTLDGFNALPHLDDRALWTYR